MNIPKWLLPVVAIITAIAVGVAALLVGARFAPVAPASSFVPPASETIPVIAPIAVGDTPADSDDGDDGDADGDGGDTGEEPATPAEPETSPEVGEREVAVGEEDPAATDTELLRLIDLVGLSPDMLLGLMHLGLGERDDDPCAPRDGDPPAGCPEGAPGTVLLGYPMPPLWLNAQAFPGTHAEIGGLPARDLGELLCDPAPQEEGTVPMRIHATAPGTWTVRYWPTDHPELAQTTVPVTSSDQQAADWAVEAEDEVHGWYIAEHCLALPGVEPATAYTAVVSGLDMFGREPPPYTVLFNSDGAPKHPGLQIQTVGQNLLLASTLHAPDETVDLRAYLVGVDTEVSCTQPEGAEQLPRLTDVDHVAVAAAERNAQQALPEFTEKRVSSFRVPEGATLLLCARWFPGEGAPVWETAQATFESSVIVQTADRMLPKVELIGFEPRDDRTIDLSWRVHTAEGMLCGNLDWSTGHPLPSVLCAPAAVAGGGADTDDGTRLMDRGFSGDLVLRVDGTLSSGETSETSYLLPAGVGACVGVCVVPPAQTYAVATIGGTATVRVSWETGRENGRTDWFVTPTVDRAVDYVAPDVPQHDDRADWEFSAPQFLPFVSASIRLNVDRQVDWRFTTLQGTGEPGMGCGEPSRPVEASGTSVDDVITIRLPDVCLGGHYSGSLELTDEAGNIAIWNGVNRDTWWRLGAFLEVPRLEVDLRYRVDVFTTSDKYLQNFALDVNGTRYPIVDDYGDGRCVRSDGIIMSAGTIEASLSATDSFGLALRIVDRRHTGAGADGCAGETEDTELEYATTTIPIRDLDGIDGVILDVPSMSSSRVHVWVTRR